MVIAVIPNVSVTTKCKWTKFSPKKIGIVYLDKCEIEICNTYENVKILKIIVMKH